MSSTLDRTRCIVLNASYEPLGVISSRDGLILVLKGKAQVVQEHDTYVVQSVKDVYPVPTSIALIEYVKSRPIHRVPAHLTQRNLFLRDDFKCQYCGRHRSELKKGEILNRDHIHPRSLGGKDEWKNVVASCSACNLKKGNSPLSETGMKLLKQPNIPTVFEIWSRAARERERRSSDSTLGLHIQKKIRKKDKSLRKS